MDDKDLGAGATTTVTATQARPRTGPATRPGLRRAAVVIGWVVAWSLAALGLLIGWVAFHLSNCKLGFFGEYGPLPDATGIDGADLVGQLIAWGVATFPWWGVMIWPRQPERRRQSVAVIGVITLVLVTLFLVPQIGRDMSGWASICGGPG